MASREALLKEFFGTIETLSKRARVSHLTTLKIPHALMCIIHIIGNHGSQNIKELAHKLQFTSSAATQSVNILVAKGLLKRDIDTHDRRKITLTLTPKGTSILKKAREVRMKSLTSLFKPLTDKELGTLHTILKKISV